MAEVTAIHPADLRAIERNLGAIHESLDVVSNGVGTVNSNVKVVYDEIESLARDFHEYVQEQQRTTNVTQAQIRLVEVRQTLDKEYGHYDQIRRTATGILQADDLGIVRKESISNATDELMISAPGYWLAPCLVALAAWINNQPELAERAVKEGIKRDDMKSSLFWALICRRAGRKSACLQWTQRYLANQDEENLDRNAIIILDAYASGLLGADSEGVIYSQMAEWLEHLSSKPGFIEQQTSQWAEAINLKRKPMAPGQYPYLQKYSHTWPALQDVMEGARLHAEILAYFTNIFEQEVSKDALKVQLDDILNSLVTDFDDEELPLRREERLNQFIIDFGGDKKRAQRNMDIEKTAFEEKKDFTQLLTDSAMKPESSNASASAQKFAIALSRDWIVNAYSDVTAKNRMKIPHEIEINVDNYNGRTIDGSNEREVLGGFHAMVEQERQQNLAQCKLTGFEQFCLFGGIAIAFIGLLMIIFSHPFLGAVAIIAGIGMVIYHFSQKKQVENRRNTLEQQFAQKHQNGEQIIRAILAEVVDFRAEFANRDRRSMEVMDFLQQLSPDQYVRKQGDERRIKI